MRRIVLDKVCCFFPSHTLDVRYFVAEFNSVEFISVLKQLGSVTKKGEYLR